MDPQSVINLFDSYWFDHEILTNNKSFYPKNKSSSSEPRFWSLRSILVRSKSEDIGSSFNYGSVSPSWVSNPKTVNSGRLDDIKPEQEVETGNMGKRVLVESKSMSELEFDLGFVLAEEDKDDSSLVEVVPGLQRLWFERETCSSTTTTTAAAEASRPYLSEAWKDLDRKIKSQALIMNWEIPAVKDEVDMKDNLKLWAHTVASFVR